VPGWLDSDTFYYSYLQMTTNMTRISFKHRSEYIALMVVATIVRKLPRPAALSFGRTLGRWSMKFLADRYELAKNNLTLAFPEKSSTEIEEIVQKNFEHVGISGVEMLRMDMFQPGSSDLQDYFIIEDKKYLDEALALGKGAILLTGHLGFWEIGSFVLPELGVQCDIVAKPMKNSLSDDYIARMRTKFGTRILNSKKGARRILQSLQQNRIVGVLLDQHISPPGSVATEFFGRKAYTTTAITNLAMKYQIPVVPVFCLRQDDNRYKVWAEPLLMLEGEGSEAIAANTQLLTNKIENAIRKDVSQWFWMHKRWRVKS